MKKIAAVLMLTISGWAAASSGIHLDSASVDLTDKASLQRGAKYFVNYCMSCHSAKYMRYSRMARDLGMPEQMVQSNLMFTGEKIFDGMTVSMNPKDATKWFGTPPPDLSLIARSRGSDWLYTYLRGFYQDDSRPFGTNNIAFKDVGMPNIAWELQGVQKAIFRDETDSDGIPVKIFDHFEKVTEGSMSTEEFDKAVNDLVSFLEYVGEPGKLERQNLGWKVILFLLFFLVIAYALKKEFWKDIH
ncbi:MAG: cytochrome c1 [Gammaproteobacteria bacterium]|nr:MAG: cytochrome c1 [Gammaproteobacteria bacterium]RLA23748.1 MAG: cytochrome c1 [Gammaproteobacteria bacterium]